VGPQWQQAGAEDQGARNSNEGAKETSAHVRILVRNGSRGEGWKK